MKLLIVAQVVDKNHPILGFFHRWIEEFAKTFDEVDVICLQKGESALPEHVHIYSLGKEDGESSLKYLYRFYKYFGHVFFRVRVEYVFFHMGAVFTLVAIPFSIVRRLVGTKFYWWKTHGHIGMKERLSLFLIDRVYTASKNSFSIASRKRRVVGHAIDVSRFSMGVGERQDLLFVGRVMPVKHVEDVIEAFTVLQKKYTVGKLYIVGPLVDTQYEIRLRVLVEKNKLKDSVVFTGGLPQDEMAQMLMRAKVLVSPSDTDSVDKVVLEAMAVGTPAVTTTEAFREMLEPLGLFVEKGDVAAMTNIVTNILDMPSVSSTELGEKLRALVVAQHNIQTLTERIFREYD